MGQKASPSVQAGEIRLIQTDGHDNYQVLLELKRGVDRGDGEGRKCRVENVKDFPIYGRPPRPYLRNSRVSAHDVCAGTRHIKFS